MAMTTADEGDFAIFIVEDEMLLVMSLRSTLREAGFRVMGHAATLAEVRHAIRHERPDLALVDLRLGANESGLEIAQVFRGIHVPCLLMTGTPPKVPIPELALGCLAKPFASQDLCRSILIAQNIIAAGSMSIETPNGLQLY